MRKSLILLGILDDSDVEWTIRVGVKQRVAVGSTIITEGEPLDSMFIVLAGEFAVLSGKARKRVATLLEGEILGEMSFIDSRPPSATVTATQDSWVLDIPREEVTMRLQDDVGFAARFYRAVAVFLSNRLRETVSTLGYGQQPRLDESVEDADEIPMDILDALSLAGRRFTILQERSRSVASA